MIADPRQTTVELADRWTQQFDAWDVCDLCCQNLLPPHRVRLRAGRAIRSARGGIRPAHGLRADGGAGDRRQAVADERFLPLLGLIGKAADDPRNFVKKAVNWALRQIGKRSLRLHGEAVGLSRTLASSQDRTARWIGRDALRELTIRKRSPGSENKAGKRVGVAQPKRRAPPACENDKRAREKRSRQSERLERRSDRKFSAASRKKRMAPAGRGSRQSARQTTVRLRR